MNTAPPSTLASGESAQGYVADPRNDQVLVYVNGAFVPRHEATVSVFDSGFVLGDGIWEGLRLVRGRLISLDAHLDRLWIGANGMALPPLLVDGRITGYWRGTGSARRRPLEVVCFAGTCRPRKAELEGLVAALEAALDLTVTGVTITREVV